MKLSLLALAAALLASPLGARAEDKGGGERDTIEVEKRERRGDGARDEGRRGRRMEGREGGGDGPRGHHEHDPELNEKLEKMRELEEKATGIAQSLREGSDAEKAAARTELRKTIGELFDARLSLETAMLARMEKRSAELKAKIGRMKSRREKAIETRFLRMSGEGDEWD